MILVFLWSVPTAFAANRADDQSSVLGWQVCAGNDSINYVYYLDSGVKNNKFGLYVYAENSDYFKIAASLVNSNGGDWGYVLIPYNIEDRDYEKWNRVFVQLHQYHLIPIAQLWSLEPQRYREFTEGAADFLDDFVWPVKDRYISVYNEPNDVAFWGGKVSPYDYAEALAFTIKAFKKENGNFFIMNGAFNASAPNSANYMDEFRYMQLMKERKSDIFERLDGWASHSYPQPNFSGDVNDKSRWSIRAYQDELAYLKDVLRVDRQLPVFITETGWAHKEGERGNAGYLPAEEVAQRYVDAFQDVWLPDDRVVAVTPFTVRYSAPHDHFSWVDSKKQPYPQYTAIRDLKKLAGEPAKVQVGVAESLGCE